jgi:hypothetical protein
MLPQSVALESCAISSSREAAKHTKTTGAVHCQGDCQNVSSDSYHHASDENDQVTDPLAASVFVISKNETPLMPCHPARARELLQTGKAVLVRRFPTVIRLTQRTEGNTQPIQLKIDLGTKTTGIALVTSKNVLTKIELVHRQNTIKKKMEQRRNYRRRRRTANLRRRPARFLNRGKKDLLPRLCDRS